LLAGLSDENGSSGDHVRADKAAIKSATAATLTYIVTLRQRNYDSANPSYYTTATSKIMLWISQTPVRHQSAIPSTIRSASAS